MATGKDFQSTAHSSQLTLECLTLGSLPHKDIESAMKVVRTDFPVIPFWPQLVRLNKNEDMIVQFIENLPGLVDNGEKLYLDNESDEFFEQLETFFMDYEEIIANPDSDLIEKYNISENNSLAFRPFLEILKETKPKFGKGQICGPFTLATTLVDKEGKCAFYDETLREIIVKMLSLKVLWQIKQIRQANPETTPIIFLDEPSMSQLGTSAFITISREEVIQIVKEVTDIIKENGALSAIHCCGKCDWSLPVDCKVDIIHFDSYAFAQNLSLFSNELKPFLQNGGIIAWGVVPTLDKDALDATNLDLLLKKFDEAIDYLVKKGIDKSLIIDHSLVSTACGAGSLSIEQAEKAMDLVYQLSAELKEKYLGKMENGKWEMEN